MSTVDAQNIKPLIDKFKKKGKAADQAAILAVNKAATFSINEAINEISSTVNLKQSYLKRKFSTISRATPNKIRAVIGSQDPRVLLSHFPHRKTGRGVAVAVNAGSGMRTIPKAFIARTLRGSGVPGIAMRNIDALEHYEAVYSRGKTSAKRAAKLEYLRYKAKSKPRGLEVFHGRTANQLFENVRVDIQPQIQRFLRKEFIKDLERLSV